MKAFPRSLYVVLCLMFLAAAAFGQFTSGDLVGTVSDASGALIANATVIATNEATNVKSTTTTNSSGEYRFSNLLAGIYSVSAKAAGFEITKINNVQVVLNQTATQRITMKLGQVETTVEVNAEAPPIDTTTAQLETTYDIKQAADLPVAAVGSGVLNLSLLQAGVGSSGGLGAGSGPSVGGQRPRNNNFMIEGVDNNDKGVTGPDITIPNDAVQNFTVLQNQFSPEFGHSTGGQFNQTVISGTNSYHGRVYEYLQNRNLNAIDVSRKLQGLKENPRFDDNRFGGQIGGPIIKNKLFFFFNYTYEPIGQATTPSAGVLAPTAAGYSQLQAISGLSATNLGILKQYATGGGATQNVNVHGTNCPAAGCPVQVGIVPIVAPNFQNNKFLVSSVDYNIGDKDQLRGRYIYNKTDQLDTAATLPVFYQPLVTPGHIFTLSEYHTFSTSITNEFRVGFSRFGNAFTVGDQKYPGLDAFPNIQLEDLNLNIGPDGNAPQFGWKNFYQIVDNVSWVKGNHTLKFGIDTAKYISPQQFTQRARGDYDYSTMDFWLQDVVPDVLAERSLGNANYYGNQYWIYSFANDIWKIRPNFSLNLGLRHEFLSIPQGWAQQALNTSANVPGLITFNAPQAPKADFSPRIGFAWSPESSNPLMKFVLGSGTTGVIRGGFGTGYDILYDNIGVLSLPPQLSQTSDCPGGPGCSPNTGFLAAGGIKPFTGTPVLTKDFCTNVIGTPVPDDAHCARLLTAAWLPSGTPVGVKYPQSYQWNLGIQRQVGNNYTVEVRYVGTQGAHLNVQNRINRIPSVDSTHFLPYYTSAPTQAQLDALTTTLSGLKARFAGSAGGAGFDPVYASQGFSASNIVGFAPWGHSSYNGLQTQITRRMTNGLLFQGAWTWSHTIDDSTADFFSTVLTPRRPQDFRNLHAERSNSALDRAHRFTFSAVYDAPFFKQNSNWFMKNLVGNWELAPVYTFETGEWADPQSQQDANLNGDAAGDRVIFNPSGTPGVGSDVTALKSSSGATVAYLVNNPNAQFYRARQGMLANSGRNILQMPGINNVDLSLIKRFNFTERTSFEFSAVMLNALNHSQFIGGTLNDVRSIGQAGSAATTYLVPGQTNFNRPDLTFPSNSRTITLGGKFNF